MKDGPGIGSEASRSLYRFAHLGNGITLFTLLFFSLLLTHAFLYASRTERGI